MADIDLGRLVTLVVHHRVSSGHVAAYEEWLKRTVNKAATYPGHMGVSVIRPHEAAGDKVFTSVLRFASEADAQRWLDSDDRRKLVAEVLPLLEDGDQVQIQRENQFWFTPPREGVIQPPLWKQAVLTFCIIYPLTVILPWLWQPVFRRWPTLGGHAVSNLLITLCIVALVVYLLMPAATRCFALWLNRRQ